MRVAEIEATSILVRSKLPDTDRQLGELRLRQGQRGPALRDGAGEAAPGRARTLDPAVSAVMGASVRELGRWGHVGLKYPGRDPQKFVTLR